MLTIAVEDVVVGILPSVGRERTEVGRLLLRMALSGRSISSMALLLSLVALASRHRGNDMVHAARAKNAAIEALVSATSPGLDSDASIEHIATGLVLCLVEVSCHFEENGARLTRYHHDDRQISTATG
jgi:hypothetical protein